jgi:heterodisulfide reductase subunit C2
MTSTALEFKAEIAKPFGKEVVERSGQNLYACYQCKRCAAGCPVGEETGYVTPDRLIRMITLGDQENALNNQLVWKCVSCYTCGTRCPNNIHSARITETIKKMAKERHLEPLEPKVVHFHSTFVNSGLRWGRVNEMEFMSFYELKSTLTGLKHTRFKAVFSELLTQIKLGLKMVGKKRMHFGFQSAKGRKEIKRLHKKTRGKKG